MSKKQTSQNEGGKSSLASSNTLHRSIVVELFGKSHEVPFPSVGKIIEAESRKVALAGGMYGRMQMTLQENTNLALDMIDAIAYLGVFVPSAKDRLDVPSAMNLDLDEMVEVLEVYRDKFKPWYDSWMDKLRGLEIMFPQKS